MVNSPTHACLEPEVLAAYADHGLSLAERARVETHLASCPRCTTLLAGVVRTVAELEPELRDERTLDTTPAVSRRAVMGAAAAAAAVIAVLALPALRPWLERDTALVSLAGSVGEQRSVLGRLTGGYPHAPLTATSAGGQDARSAGTDPVQLTAGRIRESFGELQTASQLHAAGVSNLLQRRYDIAAQLLMAATREQPANARYLNDAATVHLERVRLGLRPDDLPRALAAAERATRLDPSLREAWFNRALAISALSLTDEARAAWTEYLKRDSVSPWAGEARQRLEELARPTPAAAWEAVEARLEQSIDAASADAAVRAQTTEARNFLEHGLFVDWPNAVLAGEGGSAELDRARVMAEAMLRVAGDALYRDAIAAIDRANAGEVRDIAAAYRAYGAASALVADDRFDEALSALTPAREQLIALNTPVSDLASLGLGLVAYVQGRYAEVEQILAPRSAGSHAYVSGRASWIRGLAAFAQGRLGDAQNLYEESLATFDRMGDVEQAAGAHNLLSGLAYHLGDKATEWRHRLAAIRAFPISRSLRFKSATLAAAAVSERADNPEAALAIQESVLELARQSGRVAAVVDVLAQRGATLLALGRDAEAAASAAEGRAQLAQMRDAAFRGILELPVLAVESDLARRTNPRQAAALAQRGIETARARKDLARLPQFHLRLAKAHIASGRLDEAERVLAEGIQVFDTSKARPAGASGLSTFDESWQLFETALQLALHRGDYERAFSLAERGRAHIPAGAQQRIQLRSLADVRQTLRADEAVLAVNQFDDELAVWVITNRGARVITQPVRRTDARRLVARQQDEIRLEGAPTASTALYDTLVRPATAQLAGVTHVSFVPDATYRHVSFAALRDRSRSRFLVESWTLATAPSVSTLRHATTPPGAGAPSALILSPDADLGLVRAVVDQYQSADVATGPAATRSKLLAGAQVMHVAAPSYGNAQYPSLSRLVLNDDAGRKYSGAVISDEIANRSLPATRLVVLDEIRTEQSYRTAGTFDLATAFLAAGVPAVLGTLPGADERATRELMVGFHRELARQGSAAETLARVQRNALQQIGGRLGAWTALVLYGSDR